MPWRCTAAMLASRMKLACDQISRVGYPANGKCRGSQQTQEPVGATEKPFITMNYNESVVSKFRANGLLQVLRHRGVSCRSRSRKKKPSYLR